MPDLYTPYQLTEDGGLIDPPTIPRFEREIADACALVDEAQIAILTEEYHAARQKIAETHNRRVAERQADDARLFAVHRQRQAEAAQKAQAAAAEQAQRNEAERLRQQYGAQPIPASGAGLISGGEAPNFPGAGPQEGNVNPDTYTGPAEAGPTLPGQGAVSDPGFVPPEPGPRGPVD